jgi:hypothetical protein
MLLDKFAVSALCCASLLPFLVCCRCVVVLSPELLLARFACALVAGFVRVAPHPPVPRSFADLTPACVLRTPHLGCA